MKNSVTSFKSLNICLKELEPFIRDGIHLETGRPFHKFGALRSREILANWLLCVVLNFANKSEQFILSTDPNNGDGLICDKTTKIGIPTEHVSVSQWDGKSQDIMSLILSRIEMKQNKGGSAYAIGKLLVVFLNNDGGEWYPNKIANNLPKPLDYEGVWVICLEGVINEEYTYGVTRLDANGCPVWLVHINKTFDNWSVEQIQ